MTNKRKIKNLSTKYMKVVEWSEEDNCYIGTCPDLMNGGVHGKNEIKVYSELCNAVEEIIELHLVDGDSLPEPILKHSYSGKLSLRIAPQLHKKLAIRSSQAKESINMFIQNKLRASV